MNLFLLQFIRAHFRSGVDLYANAAAAGVAADAAADASAVPVAIVSAAVELCSLNS